VPYIVAGCVLGNFILTVFMIVERVTSVTPACHLCVPNNLTIGVLFFFVLALLWRMITVAAKAFSVMKFILLCYGGQCVSTDVALVYRHLCFTCFRHEVMSLVHMHSQCFLRCCCSIGLMILRQTYFTALVD
jgi:hypothetical protein